jgi:hypothetical protein
MGNAKHICDICNRVVVSDSSPILKKGCTYYTTNSELKVKVLNIAFETSKYYKVKLCIGLKRNNDILETPKYYKLLKSRITHWKECK